MYSTVHLLLEMSVSKYTPLKMFFLNATMSEIPMTFEEVAGVVGDKLPPSAYEHRPWWANEAKGHVHAKAWLDAGFETAQVDMEAKKLVFKRVSDTPASPYGGLADAPRAFEPALSGDKKPRRSPLFGALKGTFTIEPGWDLTKPAFDEDELAAWDASLDRKADLYEQGLSGKKP